MGTFQKLKHAPQNVQELWCSSHFNYVKDQGDNFYAWGYPHGFVLANGNEDDPINQARLVSEQNFWKSKRPLLLGLGNNFVCYVSGMKGSLETLKQNCKKNKGRVRMRKFNTPEDEYLNMNKRLNTIGDTM